jgi:hypothetical protein
MEPDHVASPWSPMAFGAEPGRERLDRVSPDEAIFTLQARSGPRAPTW